MKNYQKMIKAFNLFNPITIMFVGIMLLGFSSMVLSAKVKLQGEVTEFGFYIVDGEAKQLRNLRSPTGYVKNVDSVVLVKQSTHVPKIKGQLFGFRFKITGFEKDAKQATFMLEVKHPLIIRENGSRTTGYSYPVILAVKDGVIENKSGYKLDNDYEMVEGEWTFQYRQRNNVIVKQEFQVAAATAEDLALLKTARKESGK